MHLRLPRRIVVPLLVTSAITVLLLLTGAAIVRADALDGPLGLVFVLLLFLLLPIVMGSGAAIIVWRVLENVPPITTGPRLLFTAATFISVCGSGPLAVWIALTFISGREGPPGAAGMWALISVLMGAVLGGVGVLAVVLRLVLHKAGKLDA